MSILVAALGESFNGHPDVLAVLFGAGRRWLGELSARRNLKNAWAARVAKAWTRVESILRNRRSKHRSQKEAALLAVQSRKSREAIKNVEWRR